MRSHILPLSDGSGSERGCMASSRESSSLSYESSCMLSLPLGLQDLLQFLDGTVQQYRDVVFRHVNHLRDLSVRKSSPKAQPDDLLLTGGQVFDGSQQVAHSLALLHCDLGVLIECRELL